MLIGGANTVSEIFEPSECEVVSTARVRGETDKSESMSVTVDPRRYAIRSCLGKANIAAAKPEQAPKPGFRTQVTGLSPGGSNF